MGRLVSRRGVLVLRLRVPLAAFAAALAAAAFALAYMCAPV